MTLDKELTDARALADAHAATAFAAGLRVENKTHQREIVDALIASVPELLLACSKAVQLGVQDHARRAVVAGLTDLFTAEPERLVGHLPPRELATLIVAIEWRGECNGDQWEQILAECERATVDRNRIRLQGILRKVRERGQPWPDLGDCPAQPSLNSPPKITITATPRRVDRAPPPAPASPKRPVFRQLYR